MRNLGNTLLLAPLPTVACLFPAPCPESQRHLYTFRIIQRPGHCLQSLPPHPTPVAEAASPCFSNTSHSAAVCVPLVSPPGLQIPVGPETVSMFPASLLPQKGHLGVSHTVHLQCMWFRDSKLLRVQAAWKMRKLTGDPNLTECIRVITPRNVYRQIHGVTLQREKPDNAPRTKTKRSAYVRIT